MDKLDGDVLLGFGDFFEGGRVVGATAPAKKPPVKGKPPVKAPAKSKFKAKIPYPKPPRTATMQKHGKVLHASRGVATKAAQTIGKAMHLLSRKPGAVKLPPGKVIPAGRMPSPAKLTGKVVHVGAAAARKMTPKAKLAVQKHNAAVAKSAKAGKVLAQHALKTRAVVKKLAKQMVAQKKLAKVMRTKAGPGGAKRKARIGDFLSDPMIGEAAAEMLQDYYTTVGAEPDPNAPGLLTDGSVDPAYGGEVPMDPTMMDPSMMDPGMDLGPLTEDPLDSGMELPPPPPMDAVIVDMAQVGGIAYDGSKGTPDGYVLSYGLATRKTDIDLEPDTAQIEGNAHFGYVWGKYDKKDPANGGVGWGSNLAPNTWNHVHGRFYLGDNDWHNPVSASEAFASAKKYVDANLPGVHHRGASGWKFADVKNNPYGPLIGNPAMKDFVGMRVDAQGNMFWLPQEAPDWLTFPIKQAAALTAQAAKKAADEAAAAEVAAQAKARADEAAAQAAQDAANALAETQAASEASIAQGTAETQAQQALVQQQQAEVAAQTLETEQTKEAGQLMIQQAQQQAAQDQQVQAMLLAQAQREQEYLAQHPEEEFAPEPEGEEGGEEEGMMEEETPGGDMMDDSSGEGYQDFEE